jgi:hypothetical protein
MTWAAAMFAAVTMIGCTSGAESVEAPTSVGSIDPIVFGSGVAVDCQHPDLGLPADLVQASIGHVDEGDPNTCELTYPLAIDAKGNTVTLACNATDDVIDSWSVTAGVSVRAVIVRSPDTGTNAYLYDPGAASGELLRAPIGEGDDTIARVKLCFEYVSTGCTLTQGYWKTHSSEGPAPYDDTWELLGETTPFFDSGMTYLEVLRTAPKGGNAFFILAHQYIAAELNGLAGASMSAVQDAFDDATALFEGLEPDETTIDGCEARSEAIQLAGVLGDYNEGKKGPGHCSDDDGKPPPCESCCECRCDCCCD